MMSANEWKSRTSAVGQKRSDSLKLVDDTLAAYSSNPSAQKLLAVCTRRIAQRSGVRRPSESL